MRTSWDLDNVGSEETMPAPVTPAERLRFAIALILAPIGGVLAAFLLIALRLG